MNRGDGGQLGPVFSQREQYELIQIPLIVISRACPLGSLITSKRDSIHTSTERILAVAHEMGNPLGMRALEPEDKSDVSNRSGQRYIDNKAKKVTQALCEYVFPVMDLDRPNEGMRYDDTAFFELQSYLGLTDTAANQGSRLFDEETTRENGGPGGDVHLHYIKQIEAMDIASMVNGAIWRMVEEPVQEIPTGESDSTSSEFT